jgi:hypothetical protein
MIRPWYRSLLFWLGLPGLVFLVWACADSTRFVSSLKWQSKGVVLDFQSWGNSLRINSFHCQDPGRRRDLTFDRFPVSQLTIAVEYPLFPSAVRFGSFHDTCTDSTARMLVIAYWLKISAYLAVWIACLMCWQRRKARLSRRAAAELPAT